MHELIAIIKGVPKISHDFNRLCLKHVFKYQPIAICIANIIPDFKIFQYDIDHIMLIICG